MTSKDHKSIHTKRERGQAIILIAMAAVGVIAIVGLMVDGGIMLLEYDRLKRGIDAASISASLQFREGYTITELIDSATEFLVLNQVNVDQVSIEVETCDSLQALIPPQTDPELCTTPPRKLVRVSASEKVPFFFLPVIGIRNTIVYADSIGEAASVDLVLVLDSSQSMAAQGGNYPDHYDVGDYDAYGNPYRSDMPEDDPSQCNPTNTCHPFKEIKDAAIALVQQLYFPYDRVAIVTFDREPHLWMALSDTNGMTAAQAETAIIQAINSLTVFQPLPCNYPLDASQGTHCINTPPIPNSEPPAADGTVAVFNYPMYVASGYSDPSSIAAGNIGGGLGVAGEQFGLAKENSLWVALVLAGSPATTGCTHNTSFYQTDCDGKATTAQGRICPSTLWTEPLCRDKLSQSRHPSTDTATYDADDYARDVADWIAKPDTVGAVIFTIGLGKLTISTNPAAEETDTAGLTQICANEEATAAPGAAGERLLCYIAEQAGGAFANHGTYNFAPDPSGLQAIFLEIASNIAIRLSQ